MNVAPPHDDEMERAVLAAMFRSPSAVDKVTEIGVTARDFYRPAHRVVFESIERVSATGRADELTVADDLKRRGKLDEVGGPVAVQTISAHLLTVSNIRVYAQTIRKKAVLRRLVDAGQEIATLGAEGRDEPDALVNRAGELVAAIGERDEQGGFEVFEKVAARLREEWERRYDEKSKPVGLRTGFDDVDELIGGLRDGTLSIVGARPGMGKTSWVMQVALAAAMQQGRHVAIFSMEMDEEEIVTRMMSGLASVNSKHLRYTAPTVRDFDQLTDAFGKVRQQAPDRLHIDPSVSATPFQMRAKCRRLAKRLERDKQRLGLVIVDYMQLMSLGGRQENRQVEVSQISRELKTLSRELKVPVIALSQLSRALEARPDKRPTLADLRESGSLEQDADLVMFLYRHDYYDPDNVEFAGKAEVIVAKNRHGELGTAWLRWVPEFTRFENLGYRMGRAA